MEADTAARIVKGLVAIRGAVARLDIAHADGRTYEAKLARKAVENEYFSLRQFIDCVVEARHRVDG